MAHLLRLTCLLAATTRRPLENSSAPIKMRVSGASSPCAAIANQDLGTPKIVHASELVQFIRETTGDWFHIEVAAYPEIHPESKSVRSEIAFFKEKVAAGANGAITQYFYSAEAYFRFLEESEKAHIDIPIVPGIMPITNLTGLQRFSQICGADLPRWLVKRLEDFDDDDALKDFGAEVVTRLCEQLIQGGAPALHFYTLNQSKPSARILDNLGF